MKKCPFCGEEIHEQAVVCVHCGKTLVEQKTGNSNQTKKPIGLIISFALSFLLTAAILTAGIIAYNDYNYPDDFAVIAFAAAGILFFHEIIFLIRSILHKIDNKACTVLNFIFFVLSAGIIFFFFNFLILQRY